MMTRFFSQTPATSCILKSSVKSHRIDPSSDTTLQLPVTPQSGLAPGSLLKLGFASVEIIEIMGFKIQDSGGYMFVSWIMFKNMRWNFNLWFVFKSKITQTRYIFLLEKLGSVDILKDLSSKFQAFVLHALKEPSDNRKWHYYDGLQGMCWANCWVRHSIRVYRSWMNLAHTCEIIAFLPSLRSGSLCLFFCDISWWLCTRHHKT